MFAAHDIHRGVAKIDILKGIDLEIGPGQAVGLVGPNGCGKTSFLNAVNGFTQLSTGSFVLDGQDITSLSVEERAQQGIGRVFQHFGIFKQLTLYQNLALAYVQQLGWKYKLLPLSRLPSAIQDEIEAVLHEVELWEKRHELAANLSGGQMRLLEIARLYLQKTRLFLLDEPTAGVSPKLKGKVIELIQKIIAMEKMVLIVEHDFAFLGQFVDKIYVMESGQIFTSGSYDEIKRSEAVREIYFG